MLLLQVLWLHDCVSIWRSVYFLGHASITAIILLGVVNPPRKLTAALHARSSRVGRSEGNGNGPVATVPAVPPIPSDDADKKVL